MGSSNHLYKLGWSDFEQSLRKTVGDLRCHGDLFDVTLAAEGKTFPAHKIVLSASSQLLLELIKITPCKHPVILLPGVTATDMGFLLEFIYTGEVNVPPDHIPSLLQVARFLNITGLSQGQVLSQEEQQKQQETLRTSGSQEKEKDLRAPKRPKKKCSSAEVHPPIEKWPRWDTASSERQNTEGGVVRHPSGVDSSYEAPTKQGTEAAVTLATLQNVVPRPTWSKMQHSLRSTGTTTTTAAINEDGESFVEVPVAVHHLHALTGDNPDQGPDENYSAIAAAADAAAVAAATLSDKKGTSEQPVACPFCNFIIKQSRNLRRHLEIKHFGGARPKKDKGKTKAPQSKDGANDTDSECSTDPAVIDHVQVEIQSPTVGDTHTGMINNERTEPKEAHSQSSYQTQQLQQYAHVGQPLLGHQVTSGPPGYLPQQSQILKGTHVNPHSILTAVSQSGTHFLGLYGTDRQPPHQ